LKVIHFFRTILWFLFLSFPSKHFKQNNMGFFT
jgi:hypothetical protein